MPRKRKPTKPAPVTEFTETDPEILEYQQTITTRQVAQDLRLYESAWDDPEQDSWQVASDLPGSVAYFDQEILEARKAVALNPYAKRVIDLAEFYITTAEGPCLYLEKRKKEKVKAPEPGKAAEPEPEDPLVEAAEAAWENWLKENPWFSAAEVVRRAWRDGESLFYRNGKKIRSLDMEMLKTEDNNPELAVVCDENDVLDVQEYIITKEVTDPNTGAVTRKLFRRFEPQDFIHYRVGADSNEKRGHSKLTCVMKQLRLLNRMTENEVALRIAQSSITKITKVAGGASAARSILDSTKTSSSVVIDNISGQEKGRPGAAATVSKGVDVQYTHPTNNFSDAGPLFSLLLQQVGAGTGWTYAQLSLDTDKGNLASISIAEGPMAEMVRNERSSIKKVFIRLYEWVLENAGLEVDWEEYEVDCDFPSLTSLEPLKQQQLVTSAIMTEVMSRETGSTRMGLDADHERSKIAEEKASGIYNSGFNNQLGGADNQKKSAQDNALKGAGGNQGAVGSPTSDSAEKR